MASDAEIIEAVLHGDMDRYAELVSRYQLAAWKLAFSFVGNFEDAKELSQNGFVKAYRYLRTFRKKARFSTWLYRIVVNECKDFFKRKAKQPALVSLTVSRDPEADDPIIFEVEDTASTPRDALANRELAQKLTEAIETLPMKQRTAFLLHHVHGLSLQEVSHIMGCRLGTVKAHLFRAIAHLQGSLRTYVNAEVRA